MFRLKFSILVVTILAAAILPGAALAHGGGVPMLTGAEAGGYRLYVWVNPGSPRAGDTVHVTVGVTTPGATSELETPITDAEVTVRFVPQGGGAPLELQAVAGVSAGSLYYEADTVLPSAGNWQVEVLVDGAAAGTQAGGSATFALPVGASKASGYGTMIAGALIVGLGILVFVRQSRRTRVRPGQAE